MMTELDLLLCALMCAPFRHDHQNRNNAVCHAQCKEAIHFANA